MKQLVAKRQVRLGLARSFRLAQSDMSYRLFRSGITVSILALAVAFLVHMLAHHALTRETRSRVAEELGTTRQLGELFTRLGAADEPRAVIAALAGSADARWVEYRRWSGASVAEFARATASARALAELADALAELPAAAQAGLLADQTPEQVLEAATSPAAVERLLARLAALGVRLPIEPKRLRQLLLEERPVLSALAARASQGHARALAAIASPDSGKTLDELIEAQGVSLGARLRKAGFEAGAAELRELSDFRRRSRDLAAVERAVLDPERRGAIAREVGVDPSSLSFDDVIGHVDSDAEAVRLSAELGGEKRAAAFAPARLRELFAEHERERRLSESLGNSEAAGQGPGSMALRDRLLIGLSFLVCVVGVANAMLMSVSERFTEIATMKCLGALNGSVLMLFMFEALMQGLVGGLAGVLLGLALALVRAFAEFGTLLAGASGALGSLAWSAGGSLLMGVVLAVLAAMGPAWLASRLAPMEAMRVE